MHVSIHIDMSNCRLHFYRQPSWGWVWHVLALDGLGCFHRCLYLWMDGANGQDDAEEWLKELLQYNREATPHH